MSAMSTKPPLYGKKPAAEDSEKQVQIRPFPAPFKAALAICNDLDCLCSFPEMKAVHDVLNGRKMTPCGPGLGLEVSDSMHFFSVHPQQDDSFAYFVGLSHQPSEFASALREGMQCGLLDTLHSWGNYSQKGGFVRQHAEWALEEMEKHHLRLPLWTNHGDRHNFQNLGREDTLGDVPATYSARGDRSDVLEYHADIVRRAGVRYVWVKELTQVPGQERGLKLQDGLKAGSYLAKVFLKGVMGSAQEDRFGQPLQMANRLIRLRKFRDGGMFYELLRYGAFAKDGTKFIPELLSLRFLRDLVAAGGACLLYMHLGKDRPSPDSPFSKDAYQALARLAQWGQSGDLWVTTAGRLCRYIELRQRLILRAYQQEQEIIVQGEFEKAGDLSDPEVSGLTFYYPEGAKAPASGRVRLLINDREMPLIRNSADSTGKAAFTVPLEPLPYCWD